MDDRRLLTTFGAGTSGKFCIHLLPSLHHKPTPLRIPSRRPLKPQPQTVRTTFNPCSVPHAHIQHYTEKGTVVHRRKNNLALVLHSHVENIYVILADVCGQAFFAKLSTLAVFLGAMRKQSGSDQSLKFKSRLQASPGLSCIAIWSPGERILRPIYRALHLG